MDTKEYKEAIKYLDDLQDENFELQEEYNNKRILKVIALLKRGEENGKYKKMWVELTEIVTSGEVYTLLPNNIQNRGMNITAIVKAFEIIKRKYFPKLESKLIKLVAELDKEVRKVLNGG